MRHALIVAAALAVAAPVSAQDMPPKVAKEYRVWNRIAALPKAFAWNGADAFGYSYDGADLEAAEYLALRSCEAARKAQKRDPGSGRPCQIVDRVQ